MPLPDPEDAAVVDVGEAALPIKDDRLTEVEGAGVDGAGVVWLMPLTEARGAEAVNGEDLVPAGLGSFNVVAVESATERETEEEEVEVSIWATVLVDGPVGLRMRRWDFGTCLISFLAGGLVGAVTAIGEVDVLVWLSVFPMREAASAEVFMTNGAASERASSPSITGDEAVPKDVLRRIVVALRLAKSFI